MNERKEPICIEQFQDIIDLLSPCMDDYLFLFDLKKDYYFISDCALERFDIMDNHIWNATQVLKNFVHSEDYPLLQEELEKLRQKEKDFHNLQYRWLDKNRNPIWINCRGRMLFDEKGQPEFLVGCINEIGEKQKADNISGLLGESSLHYEMLKWEKKNLEGFMLRIGIDNFKEVNENKGMEYGDMVLRKTADCIAEVIRPGQKLYRIVADEFIVIDTTGGTTKEAKELYKQVRYKINDFMEENCYEVFYTISAGILDFSKVQANTYLDLMKRSEFALSQAKSGGKNKAYIYEEEEYKAFKKRRKLLLLMRLAINEDFKGFEVYYQPIMDIKKKHLVNAEALLRFHTEETGMVSPVDFIPILEESGLIIPVGKWVLQQAMAACSQIQKEIPGFKVSVNLSYIQVLKSNVLSEILNGIREYELPPESIVIELTESGFFESNENFIKFCKGLRENGVSLALDDFGTGYSNFHYLCNLNPNVIKIDRSFTLKALQNSNEYKLLNHMVDMTHSIDLKLCIEGIETGQELEKICQMEPDFIQGFYFGRPRPLPQFFEDYVNKEAGGQYADM